MIRLIILPALTSVLAATLLMGCSSSGKKENNDKFEVKTVDVDKNAPAPVASPGALPMISGLWKSVSPEPMGNGHYAMREFNFTLSRWELTYTLAEGKEMKKPLFVYRAEGPYIIEKLSPKKPGAFLTLFKNSRKYINLKTKDKGKIKELGLQSCGLTFNKEKDISNSGCDDFKSVTSCPQDFDLIKLENGQLSLGERSSESDLCSEERRPEGFGPALRKLN